MNILITKNRSGFFELLLIDLNSAAVSFLNGKILNTDSTFFARLISNRTIFCAEPG